MPVDLKDIKSIIDLMKKNSITEFELERQDFKIRLKRGGGGPLAMDEVQAVHPPAYLMPAAAPMAVAPPAGVVAKPAPSSTDVEVKSPMIGTFYRAPSPESDNYVEVGSEVNADTVVCIIEAMKVMNEIKAETKGIVAEILVDNAKPVEFGQPLFRIRPA